MGETTELDCLQLTELFILSLLLQSNSVSHRHSRAAGQGGQNAFEPPRRFSNVASSRCPGAFLVQSRDSWLHPPWV